jgi:hypothetical protein
MQMSAIEVNKARMLQLTTSVDTIEVDPASSQTESDEPTEVSFMPFPSIKGGGRALYNRTVFSPSMGVTAEELAVMREAKSRHVVIKSPDLEPSDSPEFLETRPAAAPVPCFRSLYNRVIHSPSMGVSEEELEALQLAAQLTGGCDGKPAHAASFGVVPVSRFRSLYRKVTSAGLDTMPDDSAAAELSALRVAACFPEENTPVQSEQSDDGTEDADGNASDLEWHVGVVPMSTFAGGTPFPLAAKQGCGAEDGSAPGSCTSEMLMRWAVSGQNLFTTNGRGASSSPLSTTDQQMQHSVGQVSSGDINTAPGRFEPSSPPPPSSLPNTQLLSVLVRAIYFASQNG